MAQLAKWPVKILEYYSSVVCKQLIVASACVVYVHSAFSQSHNSLLYYNKDVESTWCSI